MPAKSPLRPKVLPRVATVSAAMRPRGYEQLAPENPCGSGDSRCPQGPRDRKQLFPGRENCSGATNTRFHSEKAPSYPRLLLAALYQHAPDRTKSTPTPSCVWESGLLLTKAAEKKEEVQVRAQGSYL